MIGESEMVKALPNAFWMALLLTGTIEAAEAAVLDGIEAIELDRISGNSLMLATAKSAILRRIEIPEQSQGLAILPLELRRLFLLAPSDRDCFVLRTLIGLSPDLCSGILSLSIHEVESALYTVLQELPSIATRAINRRDGAHPAHDATGESGVCAWSLAR